MMASHRGPMAAGAALLALGGSALSGCDNSEAYHKPEFTLSRMMEQPRAEAYGKAPAFADGLAMRVPPRGTVPRTEPNEPSRDEARAAAVSGFIAPGSNAPTMEMPGGREPGANDGEGGFRVAVPMPVTRELLALGHARFETVCATCHGILGDGNSVVATKMESRKPPSFHEGRWRTQPAGEVYQAITRGYGLMPAFAAMLSPQERWAVVAYLDALRLSQSVSVSRLDDADRKALAEVAQ